MNNKDIHLDLLRKLELNPAYTQRELSQELGVSLGKINYCIKKLSQKGFVKLTNFKKNPNKVITIIINYEKILVKIIKMKMLGWGYRPSLEHSPIKLSKGKIKFKTRRKKMTLAEKNKFLARLNKGRIKAGLKPIRAKR